MKRYKIIASCNRNVESATVEELQRGMKNYQNKNKKVQNQLDKLQKRAMKSVKNSNAAITNAQDYNLTIEDVLDVAYDNIDTRYSEINSKIQNPTKSVPYNQFYITQYDVGMYVVYVTNDIIYVKDAETLEVLGVYKSLNEFKKFITRLNNNSSQMYDNNYSIDAASKIKASRSVNAARSLTSLEDYVEFDFDADITIYKNGQWEFDDSTDLTFVDGSGPMGDWESFEYDGLVIVSAEDVLDDFQTLLESTKLPMPDTKTSYHISGIASLAYDISNIGQDIDDYDDYFYDYDEVESTFDITNSYISNWVCEVN